MELNASDERGIQVIRDKVKTFSQLTASGIRPDGKPCPPFKIIILDEADSMTHAAQAALRRTMEKETKTTRFCLICNYVSRIIPPLTSRCTKFRFKPLGSEFIRKQLQFIASEEKVSYKDEALDCLVKTSNGDMRCATTSLQSCARLRGHSAEIEMKDVVEVLGVVPDKWLTELIDVCSHNNFEELDKFLASMLLEAYSVTQMIEQLHDKIVLAEHFTDKQKTSICEKLALCNWRIQDGASEYIEMLDLCYTVMQALQS